MKPGPGMFPKPAPPKGAGRVPIMKRYARLHANGFPMRCGPAHATRQERKIIFDTLQDAVDAELALRALGDPELRAYPCPLSRSGHYHLSSDLVGKVRRPEELPPQA